MIRRVAEMGEVRVDVRLSNAFDRYLVRREQLDARAVRSVVRNAVVDTGAVMSVLPRSVVEDLGLDAIRSTSVRLADGEWQTVDVVDGVVFELLDRETTEDVYVLGNEVLIGQTVLEKLDLLVDCTNQCLVGRYPNGPLHRV